MRTKQHFVWRVMRGPDLSHVRLIGSQEMSCDFFLGLEVSLVVRVLGNGHGNPIHYRDAPSHQRLLL